MRSARGSVRQSLDLTCLADLRTLSPQDRNPHCDCPYPPHPHALRYGRSGQAPVYLASRTYGHCRTSRTGPHEARSQRLHVAENSATEFIELYTSTTPMHSSHCEQRTVQGETESEPVGSGTDTVERGSSGWIKPLMKNRMNLCQEVPMDLPYVVRVYVETFSGT
jgi:hypothetical protein